MEVAVKINPRESNDPCTHVTNDKVSDGPCYSPVSPERVQKLIGGFGFINLWENFKYAELVQSERHKQDKDFGRILRDIRVGSLSEDDEKILRENCMYDPKGCFVSERLDNLSDFILTEYSLNKNVTCLLPTNEMCGSLNDAILKKIKGDLIVIDAEDVLRHRVRRVTSPKTVLLVKQKISKLDTDARNTAGLEASLNLKKLGAK